MKAFIKALVLTGCLFFGIILVLVVGGKLWDDFHLIRPILHADHKAILAACRTMIAERQNYRNDREDSISKPGDPVIIYPVKKSEVPAIIKNMHPEPKYILIYKDHVEICFSALPRVYLYGFAEGAEQEWGTKLIDGLWLGSSI